ncbi:hypothetical protein [Filomicrobium sp.]|uniref:hypothetical protein n=1 Tax=Filomicrobium sp. TaxID=2024831 RepID=UPI002588F34D|nr:hypothetical protein [Filomicrobium sp.]MCV0369527.1 hypothetical protein [Filomicrobium sp.]
MQETNNLPSVSAQYRNGKNDKITPGILSRDRAEYIAETVEVYRDDTGASVISVREKVEPAKPKVRRNRAAADRDSASGPENKEKNAERAQAFRRLSSLRKIYATRSPALFRSRHRVALLTLSGGLLAFVAGHDGRKFSPADLQRWAGKHVREATPAEIAQAFEAAMKAPRAIPASAHVGFALELSKEHWFRAGRPWGIHPADMTEDDVKGVQRAAKRAHDRLSAAAKRAANGATPREQSKAAIARKLGISPPTLRKRMREAGFDKASEFFDFVASTLREKNYRRDANGKCPPTDAGGSKAAAGRSVRTKTNHASNGMGRASMGSKGGGRAPASRGVPRGTRWRGAYRARHSPTDGQKFHRLDKGLRTGAPITSHSDIHRSRLRSGGDASIGGVGSRFFLGWHERAGTPPPEFERIRNFRSYVLFCRRRVLSASIELFQLH